MNNRIIVSPSLLSADFSRLGEEVRAVEEAGADWLHVDVMDGHFVPNITIGPMIVAAVKKMAKIPVDVHLMISEPDRYLDDFHQAGADILHVHPEATHHLHRTLTRIREIGNESCCSVESFYWTGSCEACAGRNGCFDANDSESRFRRPIIHTHNASESASSQRNGG